MVFTDSCFAESIKLHVLTTRISASSARAVSSPPARSSSPIITSESTRFFGQPSDTKPILGRAPDEGAHAPAGCADTIGVSLVASRTVAATLPFYGSFTTPAGSLGGVRYRLCLALNLASRSEERPVG